MRKIIIPFLLLLFIFSCQKEEVILEEEAIQSTIIAKNFSTFNPREIIEINLRWTSYITGSVLKNNAASRVEVSALLQNGNNTIKLHQLLENNTAFAIKFREYAAAYFLIGYPKIDKSRPNPPPQGNPIHLTDIFIEHILNENCIELYFPKSMDFSGDYNITSTGHPMNATDDSNDGIIRYLSPRVVNTIGLGSLYSTTHEVMVTDAYVQENENIIIARPYRIADDSISEADCSYTEYNDIADFKDFLE